MDDFSVETVEFDEAFYEKNIRENNFEGAETDGKGVDRE